MQNKRKKAINIKIILLKTQFTKQIFYSYYLLRVVIVMQKALWLEGFSGAAQSEKVTVRASDVKI